MKKSRVDWGVLRGAIIMLLVCVTISGGLLAGSMYYRDEMRSDYKKEDTRFKNVSRKYLAVDQEEKMIMLHYPRFKFLYHKGVIGKEKRLDWLETLRATSDKLGIPSLRYNIDSREIYTPAYGLNQGAYQIYTSTMKLELGLLHEDDLFKLFNELEHRADGLFTVSGCDMHRREKEITRSIESAKLQVSCELLWFTIDMSGNEIVL